MSGNLRTLALRVHLRIEAGRGDGKLSSPVLLRRLGSDNRQNRLFIASQALGNVVRSIYLLQWMSDREMRQDITANTNKAESYNGFSKWMHFGGDVIPVNEPDEQQKRLRYNDLLCSAVILQNTEDMTMAIHKLKKNGWKINVEDLSFLSP